MKHLLLVLALGLSTACATVTTPLKQLNVTADLFVANPSAQVKFYSFPGNKLKQEYLNYLSWIMQMPNVSVIETEQKQTMGVTKIMRSGYIVIALKNDLQYDAKLATLVHEMAHVIEVLNGLDVEGDSFAEMISARFMAKLGVKNYYIISASYLATIDSRQRWDIVNRYEDVIEYFSYLFVRAAKGELTNGGSVRMDSGNLPMDWAVRAQSGDCPNHTCGS